MLLAVGKGAQGRGTIILDHEGAPCTDSRYPRHCKVRWRGVLSRGFGPDVEELVGRGTVRPAAGQREGVGAVPLGLDDGDRADGVYAPDNGSGRQVRETGGHDEKLAGP